MGTTFRAYEPDQMLLMPPALQDWLPEEHLSHFVSETVDQLDLSAFYEPYEGDGRRNRPYDPRMMVKVLIYAYATGTFSSRRIAARLHEDVALRVLAAGNFPSHRTIARFRLDHLEAFEDLFVQVAQVAAEAGLVKLGRVALDGSKVGANASKHKAMSYDRMGEEEKRLKGEIRELTRRARLRDEEEDEQLGADNAGEDLPGELGRREDRLEKIRAARRRLEERQAAADRKKGRRPGDGRKSPRGGRHFKREFGVPPGSRQDNFTDPDSRIMKSSGGFQQSYNAQVAVDDKTQIIVGARVTNNASDAGQLVPLLEEVRRVAGLDPAQVLTDAGYKSEDNLRELERRGIEGYVSLGREGRDRSPPGPKHPATGRMHEKLESEQGRAVYRRRKAIVEPVVGWIKAVLGFRRFSLRGEAKADHEWSLVCLALNLRRMNVHLSAT